MSHTVHSVDNLEPLHDQPSCSVDVVTDSTACHCTSRLRRSTTTTVPHRRDVTRHVHFCDSVDVWLPDMCPLALPGKTGLTVTMPLGQPMDIDYLHDFLDREAPYMLRLIPLFPNHQGNIAAILLTLYCAFLQKPIDLTSPRRILQLMHDLLRQDPPPVLPLGIVGNIPAPADLPEPPPPPWLPEPHLGQPIPYTIHDLLDPLLASNIISGPQPYSPGYSHCSTFTIPKSHKSSLIMDLRLINSFFPKPPTPPCMSTPRNLMNFVSHANRKPGPNALLYYTKFDISNFFWGIVQSTLTSFTVNCECHGPHVYITNRLPFGHSYSPFIAQHTMNNLINEVQPHELTSRHILYDDVLLSSVDRVSLDDDTRRTIDHASRKLPIAFTKSTLKPTRSLTFIGLLLCSGYNYHSACAPAAVNTMRTDPKYILTLIHNLALMYDRGSAISHRTALRIAGCLLWCSLRGPAALHLHHLHDQMAKHELIHLTPAFMERTLLSLSLAMVPHYHVPVAICWGQSNLPILC